MSLPSHVTVIIPQTMPNKVTVIKAIRELTGLGLKEAKDISDIPKEYHLRLDSRFYAMEPEVWKKAIEDIARTLRQNGVGVGAPVFVILDDLRKLGAQALEQGEDELANEILQLVLAEKLRRSAGAV